MTHHAHVQTAESPIRHLRRPAAVVLLASLAVACGRAGDAVRGTEAAPAPPVMPLGTINMTAEEIRHGGIAWQPVTAMTSTDTVTVPGQLTPNEDRTVRLSAPARARVLALNVRIGDRVKAGQPLVTLQGEDAAMARAEFIKATAELRAAEAAARFARTSVERAERLLALKAVSLQDVERAHVERDAADAARLQAEADVERARATLMQLGVDVATGAMVLAAPFAGIVLTRDVVPGSVIEPGTTLATVTDPDSLWLEIAATERVGPLLRTGNVVSFSVPELLPETFTATIENVAAALDPLTRTLSARALVRNTAGRLRAAMFANVVVSVGQSRDGVGVPEGAMQLLDERPVVFVAAASPDGSAGFERRDVETGSRVADRVHVLKGLRPGEIVVTDGAFAVKSAFARAARPAE